MRTLLLSLLLPLSALAQAHPGGPAAQAPMPTDSECTALPPLVTPIAFGAGEVLEFDVDAMGARAAQMTMRVKPQRDGRLPIEIHVETNTFFNKVRRVSGTGLSSLNPKTLRPYRYFEDSTENDTHRVADVTFDGRTHQVALTSTIDGQTGTAAFRYANDGLDVSGTIYLLRQLPFKKDLKVCFDAYGIRRLWRVWGTVAAREHVSMPVGEFDAWHLSGQAARLDLPGVRREIHVWVSDDARRLPLAALGSIDLGAVRATLTAYRRPGDRQARAENRGNLKW